MKTKQRKGRKKSIRQGVPEELPFYPDYLIRGSIAVLGALAVIAVLAALFPLPLGQMADPLAEPESGLLRPLILKPVILLSEIFSRPALISSLVFVLALLFVLLPVLDRSGQSSIRRRILVAIPFLLWMVFLFVSIVLYRGPV